MSSYCQCVHRDKLVPSYPIILPVFSFLPHPTRKIFTFQFSTGCLAKSSESPAREQDSTLLAVLLGEKKARITTKPEFFIIIMANVLKSTNVMTHVKVTF